MLGLSDLTERFYSRGILLSIPKYLLSWKRQLLTRHKNPRPRNRAPDRLNPALAVVGRRLGEEHHSLAGRERQDRVRARHPAFGRGQSDFGPRQESPRRHRGLMGPPLARRSVQAGFSAPGLGWHSLRRKFATELKHTPLKDLCYLGGWKEPQTVPKCYQRPDESTMREALEGRKPLKAVGG